MRKTNKSRTRTRQQVLLCLSIARMFLFFDGKGTKPEAPNFGVLSTLLLTWQSSSRG